MRHLVAFPALLAILLVGPLAGTALAQAAPRSIGDCERIKGDLAYNQCLALFGPRANARGGGDGAGASAGAAEARQAPEPRAEEAPAPSRRYGRRSRSGRAFSRGRQRASFSVGSGRRYSRRSRRR